MGDTAMFKVQRFKPVCGSSLAALSRTMRQGLGQKIGLMLATLSLASSLSAPAAMGQVITDPRAPIQFRPKVGASANGTPVVNIAQPSFGGISHNKFQRYDIDARGIILNNSKLTGTSLIGGKVVANPNLDGQRPARTILNEVTSNARSVLNGPTEVFGAKAEVIVANPNGVACNGCSFINSGRVTLSTGVPMPDYRRGTVKFDVARGTVSVKKAGLLGMNEILGKVDLIGRQLKISGPIRARDAVRLRAGGMIYDQRGDTITAKSATELPAIAGLAIQSTAAGKIAAGTISVLSKDLDTGIQLNGTLTAHSQSLTIRSSGDATAGGMVAKGDIQLSADGQLRLTGNGQALGRIVASARGVAVALDKELLANDTIVFEALETLATRGVLKAGNAISLVSDGQLLAEGIIASNGEIAFEGKSFASKGLKISGRSVSVAGLNTATLENTEIVATKDSIKISGLAVDLGQGTVFQAKDRAVVDAKDSLTNRTQLNYQNLDLSVRNVLTNTDSGQLVLDHVLLTVRDKVDNAGLIYGNLDTKIDVAALTNAQSGVIYGPEITLTISRNLTNLGQIVSDRTFSLIAGDITNNGTIKAGTKLTLRGASYRSSSTEAALAAATADLIVAGGFENAGQVIGNDGLSLIAGGTVANSGALVSDHALSLTAANYRSTSNAQFGGKSVIVRLTNNLENLGFIAGTDVVDIEALNLTNGPTDANSQAGQILGKTLKFAKLASMTNNGAIEASDTLDIGSGKLVNVGSLVGVTGVTLTVAGEVSNNGSIKSAASTTMMAGSYLASAATALISSKDLSIDLQTGMFDNAGTVYGSNVLTLTSGNLTNRGAESAIGGAQATIKTNGNLWNEGEISADSKIDLTVHGAAMNMGTLTTGAGNLTLAADGAVSSTGILSAAGQLSITAASLGNDAAAAQMGGSTMVARLSGDFVNQGFVNGGTNLDLLAQNVVNGPHSTEKAGLIIGDALLVRASGEVTNQGILQADASLTVQGSRGLLNTGTIGANNALWLNLANAIDNRKEIAAASLKLTGASYSGASGSSLNGFDVTLGLSGDFTNAGKIDARSLLSLGARNITNSSGGVMGADQIDLHGTGDMTNAGGITAQSLGLFDVTGGLTNTGDIKSVENLSLTIAGALVNGQLIQANDSLVVTKASQISNQSGARFQGKNVSLTSTGKISNAGVIDGTEGIFIKAASLSNHGASASNYASISSKVLSVDVSGALSLGTNSLLQGRTDANIKAKTVNSGFFDKDTIADGRFSFGNNLDFTLTQGGWTFTDDFKIKGDLSFRVAGDIVNHATIAAGGSLLLESTSGSITNGINSTTTPGGGVIYSNGDMTLKAADDLNNYASVIQSGGNLTINVGGKLTNTRTDTITVFDGWTLPPPPYDVNKFGTKLSHDEETSGPSTIQADGSISINANHVLNVSSSIIAGANFDIVAGQVDHLARTLNSHEQIIKTGGSTNVGQIFEERNYALSQTPALLYAAGYLHVQHAGAYNHTGTIQANQVVIIGPSVTIGISNPNLPTAPGHIPDANIDLASAINLIGQGLVPGSGPAYIPDPNASTGAVSGDRPNDRDVKVRGKVSFLYATPVPSGAKDRNPSWIFAQVGANAANLTFFADPATERRLIQQALIEQTGRVLLDPKYRNPKEQQEALYEGTVDFLKANPEVELGAKLTKAQRAKVTKPILWYEYQIVDGKKVLVPQLILPENELAKYASVPGGAIFAEDVAIKGDKVTNTGTILAVNSLSIDAKEFRNERRVASDGGSFALQSGGLTSAKTMAITTKGDLINRGGSLIAGETLVLKAGGNIRIEAQTITNSVFAGNKKSWSMTTDVTHAGGLVSSGGNLVMEAQKTLNVLGSTVAAGGDALLVGKRGVTIASVLDEHEALAGGKKSGLLTRSSYGYSEHSLTNVSSVVSAGGSMTVRSETGDITIAASHLVAKKDLAVLAGNDADGNAIKGSKASVHVLSGQDVKDTAFMQKKSGFGLFATGGGVDFYHASKTTLTTSEAHNVASSLTAGGNIAVKARRDVDIIGSVVNAQGFASLEAGRDVNVGPGQDGSGYAFSRKEKGFGIKFSGGEGGFSINQGYHASSQYRAYDRVSVAPSILYGGKGVSVKGGRDVTLVAANVTSKGHVDLDAGRDLKLLAGANRESSYQSSKEVFAGISLKVSENVSGAVRQLSQAPATFTSGYGGSAYKAIGMVSGALQVIDGFNQLTSPSVSARLTLGASGAKSSSWAESLTAVPTTVKASSFSARSGRDMHFVGAQIDVAKDASIAVGRHFMAESAPSYAASASSSKSWNAGVGVYAGLGATGASLGLTAEGGFARSKGDSTSITQLNTHLNIGGTLTFTSEGNATFAGAVVKARDIDATVRGNLTVASRQDVSHGSSSAANASGSVNIGIIGPSSVSLSGGGSRGLSDAAWVSEQSGLFASNKLHAYVERHTQIDGAVLASDTGRLTLDTGTLTVTDIHDRDKGTSVSAQLGLTLSDKTAAGTVPKTDAQGNLVGGSLSGTYEIHDRAQETRGTIGQGTITIRDKAQQKQDVASINRDVSKAQVIIKDVSAGAKAYVSDTAVKEVASGFAGIRNNFEALPETIRKGIDQAIAGKNLLGNDVDQLLGSVLDKIFNPNIARIGEALKKRELDYNDLARSLATCGQSGINIHDLLFTPAYAGDGCPVTLSNGQKVYLTKSEQESCWYAAGQVALGILRRSANSEAIGAAASGFAAGALEAAGGDLRAMGKLGAYAVALTYDASDARRQEAEQFFGSMRDQVASMLLHPVDTLKGAATELVNQVQDQSIRYAQAAVQGDYVTMGRIEGELTYQIAAIVASSGAAEAVGKGTLDAIRATMPKIAEAAKLGLGKVDLPETIKVVDANIKWNGGIAEQGLPWEDYLARTMLKGSRLPPTFKTFDFFDERSGVATSAKTLDTMTAAKIANPEQIYYSLKRNIDDVLAYDKTHSIKEFDVDPNKIMRRELFVAVPQGTTATQWGQIEKAISYAQSRSNSSEVKVNVKITVVR